MTTDLPLLGGWMFKEKQKKNTVQNYTRRWFCIRPMEDGQRNGRVELALCYYRTHKSKVPIGFYFLSDFCEVDEDTFSRVIILSHPCRVFRLRAEKEEEHVNWISNLSSLCKNAKILKDREVRFRMMAPKSAEKKRDLQQRVERSVVAMHQELTFLRAINNAADADANAVNWDQTICSTKITSQSKHDQDKDKESTEIKDKEEKNTNDILPSERKEHTEGQGIDRSSTSLEGANSDSYFLEIVDTGEPKSSLEGGSQRSFGEKSKVSNEKARNSADQSNHRQSRNAEHSTNRPQTSSGEGYTGFLGGKANEEANDPRKGDGENEFEHVRDSPLPFTCKKNNEVENNRQLSASRIDGENGEQGSRKQLDKETKETDDESTNEHTISSERDVNHDEDAWPIFDATKCSNAWVYACEDDCKSESKGDTRAFTKPALSLKSTERNQPKLTALPRSKCKGASAANAMRINEGKCKFSAKEYQPEETLNQETSSISTRHKVDNSFVDCDEKQHKGKYDIVSTRDNSKKRRSISSSDVKVRSEEEVPAHLLGLVSANASPKKTLLDITESDSEDTICFETEKNRRLLSLRSRNQKENCDYDCVHETVQTKGLEYVSIPPSHNINEKIHSKYSGSSGTETRAKIWTRRPASEHPPPPDKNFLTEDWDDDSSDSSASGKHASTQRRGQKEFWFN